MTTLAEAPPMTTLTDVDITISPDPAVFIHSVTPGMAKDWLDNRNASNRHLNRDRGAGYAKQIDNGKWKLNGATICFDRDGRLIDGQHRLAGIENASGPVPCMIAVGLEPEAKDTIDIGSTRSVANLLQMRGIVEATNVSAAARLCWGYENRTLADRSARNRSAPVNILAGFVDEHSETLVGAIRQGRALNRHFRPAKVSVAGAAYWIFVRADAKQAPVFWGPMMDGAVGDDPEHPILVLRRTLLNELNTSRKAEPRVVLAWFIKAWNAWREDRPVRQLMWKPTVEQFPVATETASKVAA